MDAGDGSAAVALSLEALPDETGAIERPFVPEAEFTLFAACRRLRESAVLKVSDPTYRVSAAFSPDGTRAVTTSSDGKAHIWDVASGKEMTVITAAVPAPSKIDVSVWGAFSPDRAYVITCTKFRDEADEEISEAIIWDAATGKKHVEIAKCKLPRGVRNGPSVSFAIFGPNSNRAVIANASLRDRVRRAAAGVRGPIQGEASARLLVGSADGVARVFDASNGNELAKLSGHTGSLNGGAFSPDGTKVVTASYDQTARVWDVASGRELAVLRGHVGSVVIVAFNADGTRVLTGSRDRADNERDCSARV
jgi:WD40 repeat protein